MEENTFLPQLILKLGNSLSSNECQKSRWIKNAIGQNKKSLFLPSAADRREQGCTSPTIKWGKQFKEKLTSHQTTTFKIPALLSTGTWRDRHSVYTTQVYSLLFICSTSGPWMFHHGEALVQPQKSDSTQGCAPLVTKFVLMALSHRFADMDSDRH